MLAKENKIRIGIVGCGKIANHHFAALKSLHQDFAINAICDTHADNLHKFSTSLNVPSFSCLDDMLENVRDLDVITLCSPSGLHAKQTIRIATAKHHVITEKPMATRWAEGIKMVQACDEANVQLFVVKQNRYQPALQLLKKAITKQRFGRIYLINLNVFWTRPQSYYDQAKWRGTWEFDGGAYMNQASHYVDLLTWLFGPIHQVQAMMGTLAMNMEAEDTGVLNIRWRSGALGSMNVTMLTFPKNLEASLTILGENGSVKIGGLSANQILHWEFATPDSDDEIAGKLHSAPTLEPHYGHTCYYQNVASTLRGETQADTDGRDGLRSLEILIAAYLSARETKTIGLPLVY